MSRASRRVNITFIRGCGSSSENARVSGLVANFRAITSNGAASVTSLRWFGATIWHPAQRISARRRPLSASAASAADAREIAISSEENWSSRKRTLLKHSSVGLASRHVFLIQIKFQ
jgi:hypothetical protein